MSDGEFEDVDERLAALLRQIGELNGRCQYRSLMRVAQEARRLARIEQRLLPYLEASFHVMNDSRHTIQPTQGRDIAIELITLLESEDRARQFQPNLPEEDYERTKWWMTACAYDNLAVNTASSNGYNSDGMHQCITDGIQVCRRTGKLECISCFREYGTDVYLAADDLDMALHHARVGISHIDPGPHDRRHVGARDSVRILLMSGQLDAAMEMLDVAWGLSEAYHSPYEGKLDIYWRAIELFHLAGCPERMEKFPKLLSAEEGEHYEGPDAEVLIEPQRDEFPGYFLERDMANALVACCRGEFEAATALLQPWDVTMRESNCLTKWFEVRIRLVAIRRLSGKMTQAEALAKPMREAAQRSRDWLTLRRLERLLDESIPATPLALAGPVRIGPYADVPPEAVASTTPAEGEASDGAGGGENATRSSTASSPLNEVADEFYHRLMESGGNPEKLALIANDVLAIDPSTVTDPGDAGQLLHVVRFVATEPAGAMRIWNWAEAVVQRHPQNARVLSMLAALGAMLRDLPESSLEESITTQRLENLFRQSLDLDPNSHENFARAGSYYLAQENFSEAERCLARGFRLARTSAFLAQRLAEVYSRTDRPRDALAVLDMALREGCDDADVAWEAATSANHLEQYEAALTYLDRFDVLRPEQPWSNHYRACALLELDRPAEALAALDRETGFNPELTYHVSLVRASCLAALKRVDEFRDQLSAVLAIPLTSVTYLTTHGLQRLFTRLWLSASASVSADDPALQNLETRLIESGLVPDEMFSAHRQREAGGEGPMSVNFYRCLVQQPLDDSWRTFPGCLADQEDWGAYNVVWGVLAKDEDDARDLVMNWQKRSFPILGEIVAVEEGEGDFTDLPGVVWQGYRGEASPDDDE